MVAASDLTFEHHGAVRYDRAALLILATLRAFADAQPVDRAGTRLHGDPALATLLMPDGPIGAVAAALIGGGARPVRAVLFDKTPSANWALAWHQDRTIAVRERIDVAGFGPWTVKAGMPHVAPPPEVQVGMATLRVHIDDVPATNAPLLVAPGSHRLGRIAESAVDAVVARCGVVACTAEAGDIWAYVTPILHASDRADPPARRRVLQVDFAATELPGGLYWLGI
ncbi:phytanoyl-CoA dioxygenase family protein [Sphingomonas immobilis]|uniref:Phytanoyl-CoA dioxygenase family protein n=1 Tax=Sphingomonas immobilis TaxID=3063997 RepID=A0ABT8ZUV6_9SPHN|nr:phytanoyl-CoA dioxygenase family protein [Sphingomonas sp. CA1-15]MDO7841358.1 phytanoyl-CoA dioxygenase family protein [Sphingomonas sp. CA1-15]